MAYAEKVYKVRNGKQTKQYTWRACYKKPDGSKGTEPGFPTKKLAEDWGDQQEAAMRSGAWIDPAKLATPFGAWVKVWKTANQRRTRTQSNRGYLLEKVLLPEWEHTPLMEVNNVFAVQSWASRVSKPRGRHDPGTVAQARSLLSTILSGAEDAGYIPANKLYGRRILVGVDHHEEDEEVWAQPDEVYRLDQRMGGVHGLMVVADCYLGLRWGELVGLHRDNCLLKRVDRIDGRDHVRHVVRVDAKVGAWHEDPVELDEEGLQAWHVAEDGRLQECAARGWKANRRKPPKSRLVTYLGPPKNKFSAREVDVPPFLVARLSAHIEAWPHEHPFSTPGGPLWLRSNFTSRYLRPAADGRKAIPRKRGFAGRGEWQPILSGFTMRGARHTADTWMKEDRVDRALRYLTMGWVPKDIEGTYEHVTPEMRKHRLDCLEARWVRGQRVALGAAGGDRQRVDLLKNS
ncbi:hypothetical protein GT044_00020 [Streptomyces sp. SID335]|uniref:hypothetical protein n=1 Tax=unclassified Streptomyces TaxID=2593676 RepID=UPI001370D230|nr:MULTISPECIES: hypothetical protein [unclassified Streptomyces]MYY79676.1 hypothetical protein [Streptomyces sp. SID335]NDZ91154.1 hypothetical protein [Streptomyces sp. SID10115]NEA03718.1 hypothetical protein [Streptomyces sp. SID10116]NEB43551.1 hypothetical protein [Streptomyces sp. SID339]